MTGREKRRAARVLCAAVACCCVAIGMAAELPCSAALLAKHVDPLPLPGVLQPTALLVGATYYEVRMTEFQQKLHRDMPPTTVWGYNGTFPGPTIETYRYKRILVNWINDLPLTSLLPVDHSIHGAEPSNPDVRTVVHLHGGEVPPESDGYPENWFVPGESATYMYPNVQQAATLWFHDHATGITRLTVMSGLAAFYIIRDNIEAALNLPKNQFEIPLVIQDRQFDVDGQLVYPNPWEPELFGDTILVNGKVWPYLEVQPRKYRFRFLNGSNSRFYRMQLLECDAAGDAIVPHVPGPPFYQIGTDGGLLTKPVQLTRLLIAPGERADVIFNFAGTYGKRYVLFNDAEAPFQQGVTTAGAVPDVMQFRVTKRLVSSDTSSLPSYLQRVVPIPQASTVRVRDMTLEEELDTAGQPVMMLLNGMHWDDPVTETPHLGDVEIWRFINLTMDSHPMHLHLVQFQILDRQPFDVAQYIATQELVFTGPAVPPDANEMGWKDTVRSSPGMVTRMITRFGRYTARYLWHCHILEHEDNEMMRPYDVLP